MHTVPLGRSGLDVSPLCLGGNVFGWSADEHESFAILDAFVEAGGNFIDTADMYSEWKPGNQGGESESIIGRWIKARGNRDQLVIATKVAKWSKRPGLSGANIAAALDDSLVRLQTDHIDLYYAHEDDDITSLDETLGAFNAGVVAGKVRAIGASNYSADRVAQALAVSRQNNLAEYTVIQPEYNVISRSEFEGALQTLATDEGLAVAPYYALARGLLTGKYTRNLDVTSVRAADIAETIDERSWLVVDAVRTVAGDHGCSMAAVALAWLRQQPGVVIPIASATRPSQLAEMMQPVTLTDTEVSYLTSL
jgi:aryl-alcohol dehydrogenase-like predicted oxidoreductase